MWTKRAGRDAWARPEPLPDETRPEGIRTTAVFGEIEAWLYRPPAPRALIIMAPGLCGTKEGPLEAFAWNFARAGYAVLSFDFRGFGASGGLPRHHVDPRLQVEDFRAAIQFARGLGLPIVLWGTSFSGAAAITAAKREKGIAAVIAHVPWLGGRPVHAPSRLRMAWYVLLSMIDAAGPTIYIRAYGRPGERAFAISEQNGDHRFWDTIPKQLRGGWENRMMVRGLKHLDGVTARDDLARLACPALVIAAMRDDMVRFDDIRSAKLAGAESRFVQFDCGHFDPYVPPIFERNLRAQTQFLDAIVEHDSPA